MAQSKAMEIAEREAAEAEVETPDEDDGDHGDTDTEQEPAQAASDADVGKALEKLAREAERHGKRVSEIMGDDFAMLEICPLDFTPGYVMPQMAAQLPDDVKDRVRALIGDGGASELRDAEGVEMCPRCDGHGQLAFPTRNPHVKTQMCPKCSGQGYVNVTPPAPENVTALTAPAWQPQPPATSNGPGTPDSWGRPPGHPHYGMPPASVGQ